MADITMCFGKGCELKETCYRYKAKPNEYGQSFSNFVPTDDSVCEYYWETKK